MYLNMALAWDDQVGSFENLIPRYPSVWLPHSLIRTTDIFSVLDNKLCKHTSIFSSPSCLPKPIWEGVLGLLELVMTFLCDCGWRDVCQAVICLHPIRNKEKASIQVDSGFSPLHFVNYLFLLFGLAGGNGLPLGLPSSSAALWEAGPSAALWPTLFSETIHTWHEVSPPQLITKYSITHP